jgi:hypothetical protein
MNTCFLSYGLEYTFNLKLKNGKRNKLKRVSSQLTQLATGIDTTIPSIWLGGITNMSFIFHDLGSYYHLAGLRPGIKNYRFALCLETPVAISQWDPKSTISCHAMFE